MYGTGTVWCQSASEAAAWKADPAGQAAKAAAEAAAEATAKRDRETAFQTAVAAAKAAAPALAAAFRALEPGSDGESPFGAMKWIPAGTFSMGSPSSEAGRDDNETQHQVTLTKGYWMMEHEVTQGEWLAVMGTNPSHFTACGPTCPVEMVSWDDAVAFAKAASKRDRVKYKLPTEAQWERAARGGRTGEVYAGGNELRAVGWTKENSDSKTHGVCQKQRNGYGLCDMSGNVLEWTLDWYDKAYPGTTTDPVGAPSGSARVIRGGSWVNESALARVANRSWSAPGNRGSNLGVRLVRSSP